MNEVKHHFSFAGRLSQSTFPDLSLSTKDGGGRTVPAHRVVLAAVSSKLAGLCQEGGRVTVRNISFEVLEKVVRFIYTGSIQLHNVEAVEDFKDGMDMLKVNIVIEKEDIVIQDIDAEKKPINIDLQYSRESNTRKETMDRNANVVIETTYNLSKELWSKQKNRK
eukprot:GFUD01018359.1.p1 GENE.GFUD01018359.1~~GFUD01018359.1.p1  ORF type:complete len:165 (-),score=48.07 GFUD01018359.1:367-861(-)